MEGLFSSCRRRIAPASTARSLAANVRSVYAAAGMLAVVACALMAVASAASAETATYSATETIPVPPASSFAGAGDGDGWAVALSETAVYNVFHHQDFLGVSCHLQANAEGCWPGRTYDTITEPGTGTGFSTSGQPGLHLDPHTGKLYVYATRLSDYTAGVVCIDTTQPASNEDPFCGFTELTGKGEGQLVNGISGTSDPMLIGTHFYAFSYQNGVGQEGTKNTLLCFDIGTGAACAGQPYDVTIETGNVQDGEPSPATAVIAGKAIIPINVEGTSYLTCFDDATQSTCSGKWPVKLPFGYPGEYGAPFPLLTATGETIGLCLPTGTDECYTLAGEETPTPLGMPSVIYASSAWNGPAFVLGPRVYIPNGNYDEVQCFDYSTGASCANFPKELDLTLLYTVNADPQRPTCIWANSDADGGELPRQIVSFDAYTGEACGQGTIRVLASQFVVPQPQCTPAEYVSLQVLKPGRNTYTKGFVQFDNNDSEPIAGLPTGELDSTGTVNLEGLPLNTPTGLPQFLFTLENESEKIGEVEAKLTWRGNYEATCIGEKTEVAHDELKLEPKEGTNTVGEEHKVTATLNGAHGEPLAGETVKFDITSGPNSGKTETGTTNAAGQASWSYKSAKTGTDSIVATYTEIIEEQAPDNVHRSAKALEEITVDSNGVSETWKEASKPPTQTTTTATTATVTPPAKGGVLAFGTAHLASSKRACTASSSYPASVTGTDIASVTFTLDGHKLKTLTKAAHGKFALQVPVKTGEVEHLSIHVAFTAAASNHSETITKTLARCAAAHPVKTPRFTG
jgi:hypothetical protein